LSLSTVAPPPRSTLFPYTTLFRSICGQVLYVPVVEAPGQTAVGRFGWKDQQASLLSFSADAYLNEMGVTSRLQPDEVTNLCNTRSEEHTSELQSRFDLVCRLLLEK